jgi:hypothetical protein
MAKSRNKKRRFWETQRVLPLTLSRKPKLNNRLGLCFLGLVLETIHNRSTFKPKRPTLVLSQTRPKHFHASKLHWGAASNPNQRTHSANPFYLSPAVHRHQLPARLHYHPNRINQPIRLPNQLHLS